MTEDDYRYQSYNDYIQSDEWRIKASDVRKRDGRCLICGTAEGPLEVHHLTYDRLYYESAGDLITLCPDCHKKVTKSWHSLRDGIRARNAYFQLARRYDNALADAECLNMLMPYDISFGGAYVLSDQKQIKEACIWAGIKHEGHVNQVQKVFNQIHVLDVSYQISNGASRKTLIEAGYPKSLIQDIGTRKLKNEAIVTEVDDVFVCYMHEGKGKWIVVGSEDGLETGFTVRFMPFMRYGNMWWDR